MIFAGYICIPGKKHQYIGRVGETHVNCWLRVRSFAEAKALAEKNIRSQHWVIISLDEIWRIPKGHFKTGSDGLPYYEQALIDRGVYVFHQSPKYPVYCVHFRAVPTHANTDFSQGTFADVKYWVVNEEVSSSNVFNDFGGKKKHIRKAISWGRKRIQSAKWRVTNVLKGQPVNYRSFIKDPLLTQYYEEAEEYGECLAFWTSTKPNKANSADAKKRAAD
jgi:hypothetical protein